MHRVLHLLVFCAAVALVRADVRVTWYEEGRDEKNGEAFTLFILAPGWLVEVSEAESRGDAKTASALMRGRKVEDIWGYAIRAKGIGADHNESSLFLFEPTPCGSPIELVSGTVKIDRAKLTIHVRLTVRQNGRLGEFVGNGSHKIPETPNKAPEPTP